MVREVGFETFARRKANIERPKILDTQCQIEQTINDVNFGMPIRLVGVRVCALKWRRHHQLSKALLEGGFTPYQVTACRESLARLVRVTFRGREEGVFAPRL